MKALFFWAGFCVLGVPLIADTLIKAKDADGIERVFNAPGRVTVIVYSNPALQERTREVGKSLDRFQGLENFRSIVLVDLRGTMADWAPGYTVRRMVKDLDQEALRVTPAYRKNGNKKNPRPDLSAVADFKGDVCVQLGWVKPKNLLRVLVFDPKGRKSREWEDLKDFRELTATIAGLIPKE